MSGVLAKTVQVARVEQAVGLLIEIDVGASEPVLVVAAWEDLGHAERVGKALLQAVQDAKEEGQRASSATVVGLPSDRRAGKPDRRSAP